MNNLAVTFVVCVALICTMDALIMRNWFAVTFGTLWLTVGIVNAVEKWEWAE